MWFNLSGINITLALSTNISYIFFKKIWEAITNSKNKHYFKKRSKISLNICHLKCKFSLPINYLNSLVKMGILQIACYKMGERGHAQTVWTSLTWLYELVDKRRRSLIISWCTFLYSQPSTVSVRSYKKKNKTKQCKSNLKVFY